MSGYVFQQGLIIPGVIIVIWYQRYETVWRRQRRIGYWWRQI